MTVDELMALLEGCDYRAEVRLAFAAPGGSTEHPVLAAASLPVPRPLAEDALNPPVVWLLAGDAIGPAPKAIWAPACRRRP